MKGPNVTRALVLAVSCLILGFVGGWSLASLGSDTVSLPDVNLDTTVADTSTTGTGTGTTGTGTTTGTTPPTTTAAAPVIRADVSVSVLNGSGVSGKAAETAGQLQQKGWSDVTTGNADPHSGTTVYYRAPSKAAADALAEDLDLTTVTPLTEAPGAGSVAQTVDLVVILGS